MNTSLQRNASHPDVVDRSYLLPIPSFQPLRLSFLFIYSMTYVLPLVVGVVMKISPCLWYPDSRSIQE